MTQKIRFGAFLREIGIEHRRISFNALTSKEGSGPGRNKLRPAEVYRIVQPYVSVRLLEQIRAVVPLAAYLFLFQLFILRQHVADSWIITAGLFAVIVGLMFFMEGLKVGLMPFGETIGTILPSRSSLPVVVLVVFLLGIGVTFAEPAIGALKTAGKIVSVEKAPYLFVLLNEWSEVLVLMVGIGVGLAAVLGTMRFIYGWRLKPLICLTLIPTLGMTLYISQDSELSRILGLAWDCGAVTTGPVTVPLVLSLGIGIAAAAGKGHSSLSGFGIVTLASLFPVAGVQLLALYVASGTTPEAIIAASRALDTVGGALPWHERTPWMEIVLGLRAIVPLVLFLLVVLLVVLREKLKNPGTICYGIVLCVLGMIIFNLGLSYGLAKLGSQSGAMVPAAFTVIDTVKASPLYGVMLGIFIAAGFAWILGFGATLAEPALNALGLTVENLTNGAFSKKMLMYAVSFGVACGISIGVLKIIFSISIAYLIVPGYLTAVVLTWLSTEEFVNVAWDSAGVTTGPVTVPLVLAMGLGFGDATGAIEGFGILSMASIGPILSVLATGLLIEWKTSRRHRAELASPEPSEMELAKQ